MTDADGKTCANTKVSPNSAASSDSAVIRVHDDAGNVIETHEHKGDFKEW